MHSLRVWKLQHSSHSRSVLFTHQAWLSKLIIETAASSPWTPTPLRLEPILEP